MDRETFDHRIRVVLESLGIIAGRFEAACLALGEAEDVRLAVTPYHVVHRQDRIKLKYYGCPGSAPVATRAPLLIVYALVNRETMLDLQPGLSVVQTLLRHGIDLYMIDWGYPGYNDKYLTLGDHVMGYMDAMVNFVRRRCGVDSINLMGVCMGGTMAVMYAALYPHKVRNLITTVTPTNFDVQTGLLHKWVAGLDVDKLAATHGNIPGEVLNSIFLLLNPTRLMVDKYVTFVDQCADRRFVENFIRMEKWIFDSPDVPGETFRQFVKDCYQENLLIQNKLVLDGHPIDLGKITMPLLNIFARYDHLVPPETCMALTQKVGSRDVENLCLDSGHIGIYVSRGNQQRFAPKIADWLGRHDPPDGAVEPAS